MPDNVIWSGTLSFGLVAIPVNLEPAVHENRVTFHILHKKDNGRLRRKMFCTKDNEMVPPEHQVKGYQVESGEYVVIAEKEFESIEPGRSKNLEIVEFVDAAQIDPVYFDRPYYLTPDGVEKPYRLLVRALEDTDKAAIARFVMRGKEYLVVIKAVQGAICIATLYYHDEIESAEDLIPTADNVSSKDIMQMQNIIQNMAASFKPAKIKDQDTERIIKAIGKKQKGKVNVVEPNARKIKEQKPVDITAALEESLARVKSGRK